MMEILFLHIGGDYIAIAKWKCVGNPEFSDELIESVEPEWWTEIPEIQVDKLV